VPVAVDADDPEQDAELDVMNLVVHVVVLVVG